MEFKIYPVNEDIWLRTFAKIKTISKKHKMPIVKIDIESFHCKKVWEDTQTGSQLSAKFYSNNDYVTVITLAEQGNLF